MVKPVISNPYFQYYLNIRHTFKSVTAFIDNYKEIIIITLIALFIFGILFNAAEYFLGSVGAFKMSQSAGFGYSWFAFIPVLRQCLIFKLPPKPFNIFSIHTTKSRMKAYIIQLAITHALPSVLGEVLSILSIFLPLFNLLWLPLGIICVYIGESYFAFAKYDLLRTFNVKKGIAATVSVLSIFCPFIFSVYTFIIRKNEPVAGYDYYYKYIPYDEDDEYPDEYSDEYIG